MVFHSRWRGISQTHINLDIVSRIRLLHANQRIAFRHNKRRYADDSGDFRFLLFGQCGEGFEAGNSAVGVEDGNHGFGAIGDSGDDGGLDC